MTQTREKWDSDHVWGEPDFWMAWKCSGILCIHFYFFCLEATLGNESIIPKVFWSLLCHSFFSTITRYISNSILRDTLQLKILQTWIKIYANSFIKTLVNIIKWESTKVPWKLSPVPLRTSKNDRVRFYCFVAG